MWRHSSEQLQLDGKELPEVLTTSLIRGSIWVMFNTAETKANTDAIQSLIETNDLQMSMLMDLTSALAKTMRRLVTLEDRLYEARVLEDEQ